MRVLLGGQINTFFNEEDEVIEVDTSEGSESLSLQQAKKFHRRLGQVITEMEDALDSPLRNCI